MLEEEKAPPIVFGSPEVPGAPKAEYQVSEAEETRARLAAIVTSCPDPIIGETLDGMITTWNPAAERMYGYRAAEAIGQPLAILTPPGYEAEVANLLHRVQQGEEIEGYETVRRARDGHLIDVSLTIFPVRDDAGRPIGLSATTRDITRNRQVAAALVSSERRFRRAFDDAPNFEALLGIDGRLLQVNRAGRQLLGYTEAELQDLNITHIVHPDDIAVGVADYWATLQGKQTGYAQEIRLTHKDGGLSWVAFQLSLIRNETGEPEYFIGQARDLTESVIAQEKLTVAQLQMQEVLDRIGGAFVELDHAWRITRINAAAADLLEHSRGELVGQRWQVAAPAALQAAMAAALEAAMANRSRVRGADVFYPPRNVWYSLSVYPSAEGIAVFLRDVTVERTLQQELRTAELRFQALVEQLPATVYVQADDRPNPAMLYISPYYARMTGYPATDALPFADADAWLELIHPEDRERVQAEVAATANDLGGVELEYRLRCANGEYIWISDVSAAMVDDSGQVIAWLGAMLDITARIQAEGATARLAAIVEGAADAIYSRTLEGDVTSWNGGAERLYGYTAQEAIGHNFAELFPAIPKPIRVTREKLEVSGPIRYETQHHHKDGSILEVAVVLCPVRDAEGVITGVSGIVRDISGRIAAERELRAALEAAKAGERAKGLFLAMMSHELRTPLQAVLGYADFLQSGRQGVLSLEQLEDIGYIHQGASRMVHLIEQMLDLSRMEAGRLELKQEAVDLGWVLEQVRQDIAPQAEGKALALRLETAGWAPDALGDAERVRQILLNLAGNAVKFTETGGITLTARGRGAWVEIAVADTGIGIAPADLSHIFEEFRQVDSRLSRRHGGAGLGLAIAQRLAEQMGGAITVESAPGQGSTFTLRLPVAP